MCNEVQTCGVLSGVNRGFNTSCITCFWTNLCLKLIVLSVVNVYAVCPTGALIEIR